MIPNKLSDRLRLMQWLVPPAIGFLAASYQIGLARYVEERYGAWAHYGVEVLLYAAISPIVLWFVLRIVRRWVDEKEQAEARVDRLSSELEERTRERQQPGAIVRGNLIIDLVERRVTREGRPVRLTPTEFRLLAALAEAPGRVMPPKTLLARVWGSDYADDVENVKRYVHYLRQKLEADVEHPQLILTERGFGYYLA
jgi:hypothetical protein